MEVNEIRPHEISELQIASYAVNFKRLLRKFRFVRD